MKVLPDIDFCEFIIEDVVKFVYLPQYLRRGILEFVISHGDITQTIK